MTGVEERMRGIGRPARESGLTVSALRFYDGAGVRVPAGDVHLLMPIRLT